jgi:hypothetical protein
MTVSPFVAAAPIRPTSPKPHRHPRTTPTTAPAFRIAWCVATCSGESRPPGAFNSRANIRPEASQKVRYAGLGARRLQERAGEAVSPAARWKMAERQAGYATPIQVPDNRRLDQLLRLLMALVVAGTSHF